MTKRTRRQFLEDSMLAAAAAAAAAPDHQILGAEAAQSRSTADRLGVAIIGLRGRGNSHISAFAGRRDTRILYLCDVDRDLGRRRIEEAGKRQRGRRPRFETDFRRALEDPRVDVVSIATPHHWHALAAIWSFQAGKDVYLEKPVGHTIDDGRKIAGAAERYGRICQTGFQCRSNRGVREAIGFVHHGKIGGVQVARGLCYKRQRPIGLPGIYQPPANVDFDFWLGPSSPATLTRKQFHHDWHWQWAYGNGSLGHQAIHQLDLARWGLGVDYPSRRVISLGGCFDAPDARQSANTQVVYFDYDQAQLLFEIRGLPSKPYRKIRVGVILEGTEGYLVITSHSSGSAFDLDGNPIRHFRGGGNHFANFLRAVRRRSEDSLHAGLDVGNATSTLCHQGNISHRLGQPVSQKDLVQYLADSSLGDPTVNAVRRTLDHLRENEFDPARLRLTLGKPLEYDAATDSFLNSQAANHLVKQEYRPPYRLPI
jgi:predicted dehydrogenase